MNKTTATLLLAVLLPVAAHADLALVSNRGVDLVPPPSNMGAVHPSEQASTLRDPKKNAGKTLRCWQHGRLVFEDKGFKQDSGHQPNAVHIKRTDGDAVTVFDQKDSLCVLSSR